jgi:hypothetical protein
MSSRDLLALVQMALLAVCFINLAPIANATSTDKSARKPSEGARSYVLEPKRHGPGVKIHLPIGPAYNYYDYPYYYRRGYYPTHIGGYIYYPNYTRNFYPRYGGRCAIEHRGCVANAGKLRRGYCRCP